MFFIGLIAWLVVLAAIYLEIGVILASLTAALASMQGKLITPTWSSVWKWPKLFSTVSVMVLLVLMAGHSFAATAILENTPASPSVGITATNYYGVVAAGATCPVLPWSTPTKVVVTGAATGATVVIPNVAIGKTLCFYATFQAGTQESPTSSVVSGVVPPPKPEGLTITGPLTIL